MTYSHPQDPFLKGIQYAMQYNADGNPTIRTSSDAIGQFGDMRTVSKTPLIELSSAFPTSVLRDVSTIAGSATVTNSGGEFRLQTTANGADSVTFDSAERGRYKPGYSSEVGIGVRIPTLPTGSQNAIWGYSDGINGVYFGVDSDGTYIARLSNSVETKVYQSNWNVDKLDGTIENRTLDLSRGNIFQIVFSWYGYGVIEFQIASVSEDKGQRFSVVHRLSVSGASTIQNPNLPIRAKVSNGGTATAFNLYVGGRQFSIVGQYIPNVRTTCVTRLGATGIGTSPTPLITIRRKSAFAYVPVHIDGVDAICSGDALLEVYLNGTLTNPSYGTPAAVVASETSIERDVSASAITGGNVLYSQLLSATGTGSSRSGSINNQGISVAIPEMQPVTLCVRSLSSTVNASAVLRIAEDW